MTVSDFWDSTPREVMQVIEGYADRYRQQRRLATLQAYYAGAIARSGGTLPPYDELFPEADRQGPELSPEAAAQEQLAVWESLTVAANARAAQREAV